MKKLVGEGKPFHSAVDKTAALLKRKVGTGAEFMKELMGVSGVKPTELQERGLIDIMGMPKMTHDQFMAALTTKPAPAVRELIFSDEPEPLSKEELRKEANNVIRERASEYADEGADTSGEYRRLAADEMRRLRSNHMGQALRIAQENHLENFTSPHHGTWTLPGGENYREMLIKSPEESGEIFGGRPGHFGGEPGILASMRVKDRLVPDLEGPHNVTIIGEGGVSNKKFNTREEANAFADVKKQGGYKTKITPLNNKKYLHLEELQSDWHQQGREGGYKEPGLDEKFKAMVAQYDQLYKQRRDLLNAARNTPDEQMDGFKKMMDQAGEMSSQLADLHEKIDDARSALDSGVPDAPFKKNWEEMALKRLIHHAAEKGYHGVVVTPGQAQADRYNLSNHIDSINFSKNSDGTVDIDAIKDRSTVVDKTMQTPEQIENMVGKEIAQKIFNTETSFGSLSGLDLKVGGEGMKGFYDKKVPSILNSIGKKYGVKTELGGHKLLGDPSERGDASERLGLAGVQLADMTSAQTRAFNAKLDEANAKQLHYFPITEDMRKDVLANGLPLYNKGGTVHMAKEGDMDHMMLEMMGRRMATGGSPTTKGYVTHEPKKPHPEVGTRFKATPQGNLAAMKAFDLMKHEGKGSIVPIPYDATTRDNLVTEVSGNQLINPLVTEAGFDYSLDPTNMAQNIGGASNKGIAKRVQDRVNQAAKENKGDVFLAPNTMGDDAENFSHHPAHIVLDLMAQRQLNKNTLRALSDDLRGQHELKRNARTGEVTKTYPYTKFLGYDHPNMFEQVIKGGHGLEATPGDLRKKMMERLSLVNMQKLLDYNMGDLKAAILDPELATDPKAYMGRTFVKAQPGAALRPSTHTSYDTDYTGINEGGLGSNRPFEVLMPDVTESIYQELKARPAKTVKTPAQMRAQVVGAIEKRKEKFAQPINARVINNAGLYEEGLKQGEFDPKNVDSVLAYFKRKGGYNKGGAVRKAEGGTIDIKGIGVREAPNMDVKAFISPRPAMKNSLPVGGVFQQTPQQPEQGMPPPQGQPPQGMTQGMPQGMPQGAPPQGMPPQPPSNILQMTPQGQAMSAIKPPQMARGGKVDRDMMMLHVMNRKMKVKHG